MDHYRRKLVVAALLIGAYLVAGTALFHRIEGWRYLDAFYFSGITLTTVGYGDFMPTHDLGKLLSVFFAFSGISIVFYSIGIIARHYFELEEERLARVWSQAKSGEALPGAVTKGVTNVAKRLTKAVDHVVDEVVEKTGRNGDRRQ